MVSGKVFKFPTQKYMKKKTFWIDSNEFFTDRFCDVSQKILTLKKITV